MTYKCKSYEDKLKLFHQKDPKISKNMAFDILLPWKHQAT